MVVPVNFHAALTVTSGGTVRWISKDFEGAFFTIHFITPLGCNGKDDDLEGSPAHAAVCKVPKDKYGLYRYTITRRGLATREALRDAAPEPPPAPPPDYYTLIVDHCPGCDGKTDEKARKEKIPPAAGAGSPDTVLIVCGYEQKAAAYPTTVSASVNQVVAWSQDGSDTLKWTATLDDDICTNGKKEFGTVKDDTPHSCQIKPGSDLGDHKYRVTLSNQSCPNQGDAILRIIQ
jgi:rRNA maturation protein Nop10